ncbi:Sec1-binding region of Mso1-domain-containing protein [Xylariales sp. AK1849]|nr:Sec1-binding region of Mso1-domain-containing protein [Xylariales sp. AK1849]
MSAWYSNILTTTTSRINNLQRTFLGGETDGDTEDDTHVCRVLRGYYTEKGRQFPGWLPPDPKAPPPVQPVLSQPNLVGARYGGLAQQGGGSLSSLWDSNAASQPQDAQSLRRGRGAPPPMRSSDPRQNPLNPFNRNSDPSAGRDDVQARPLPSQRAGSYQNTGLGRDTQTPPGSSAGGSGTAQDRLRQRLWGGSRTASPAASGPFKPPAQQSGSKGGGSADYEDRFAPGGMYDASPGGEGGSSDRPFMAANSPWASNEQEFYSGGGGGGGSGGRSGGLPGANRRAGLPSGPRMR